MGRFSISIRQIAQTLSDKIDVLSCMTVWHYLTLLLVLKPGKTAAPCLHHCITAQGCRAFPHLPCWAGTANSAERFDGSLLTAMQLHVAVSSCRHWCSWRGCGGEPSVVQHTLLSHLNMSMLASKLEMFQLTLYTSCQRLGRNLADTGQRSSKGCFRHLCMWLAQVSLPALLKVDKPYVIWIQICWRKKLFHERIVLNCFHFKESCSGTVSEDQPYWVTCYKITGQVSKLIWAQMLCVQCSYCQKSIDADIILC